MDKKTKKNKKILKKVLTIQNKSDILMKSVRNGSETGSEHYRQSKL